MAIAFLRRFVEFVLAHRVAVSIAVVLVSIGAAAVLPRVTIASSLRSMFFGPDHPAYNAYSARIAQFGTDEVFLFGLEVDDPFSKDTLDKLDRFHELAESSPEVEQVSSIANLTRVGLVGDTIGVRKYADLARDGPGSAAVLEEVRADPIAGGLLVSKDRSDVLVIVENTANPARPAEQGPVFVNTLRGQLVEAGFDDAEIYNGGLMAVLAEMVTVSRDNLLKMFPLVTLCLLLAVYAMFGRLWPVAVTTTSALLAVLWTSAFSILREPTINILMSILPTFVMIISFSDVVHICSAYLLNLEKGAEKHAAIVEATAEVGAACLLTSITTGVGFYALTFVPSPSFQELGLAAAVGVLVAYALAMVVVPLMLSVLDEPLQRTGSADKVQEMLSRLLDRMADLTTRRPWPIIGASMAVFAFLVWATTNVSFETDFSKRLGADNQTRLDNEKIAERFVSSSIFDVYIDAPAPGGVLDAATFEAIVDFEREIESWPQVDKVVSLVDLMRATHGSIVGPDATFGDFDDAALAQMMVLLEMEGPDALRGFIDFERQRMRMTVYTNDSGIVGQFDLAARTEREAKLPPGTRVEATGVGPLMGGWLDDILEGQKRGLGFSLLTIMLLLVIGFRSLRAGVVSMVPNLMPLFAAGAWCGLLWGEVDSDTLIVAMIAIGIGVDDTIHFISRFQTEMKRNDRPEALRETFRYSGRGIFITTFVFVVGFLPAMTSEYYSIWVMGLLLPVCFVVALLADLLFVPALCAVGLIR